MKTAQRHRFLARQRRCWQSLGWLAILPFFLFTLILPGTMPTPAKAGGLTMVLCAEGGLVLAHPDGPDATDHGCGWGPHMQSALPVADLSAPLLLPRLQAADLTLPDARVLHVAQAPIPAARDPPFVPTLM